MSLNLENFGLPGLENRLSNFPIYLLLKAVGHERVLQVEKWGKREDEWGEPHLYIQFSGVPIEQEQWLAFYQNLTKKFIKDNKLIFSAGGNSHNGNYEIEFCLEKIINHDAVLKTAEKIAADVNTSAFCLDWAEKGGGFANYIEETLENFIFKHAQMDFSSAILGKIFEQCAELQDSTISNYTYSHMEITKYSEIIFFLRDPDTRLVHGITVAWEHIPWRILVGREACPTEWKNFFAGLQETQEYIIPVNYKQFLRKSNATDRPNIDFVRGESRVRLCIKDKATLDQLERFGVKPLADENSAASSERINLRPSYARESLVKLLVFCEAMEVAPKLTDSISHILSRFGKPFQKSKNAIEMNSIWENILNASALLLDYYPYIDASIFVLNFIAENIKWPAPTPEHSQEAYELLSDLAQDIMPIIEKVISQGTIEGKQKGYELYASLLHSVKCVFQVSVNAVKIETIFNIIRLPHQTIDVQMKSWKFVLDAIEEQALTLSGDEKGALVLAIRAKEESQERTLELQTENQALKAELERLKNGMLSSLNTKPGFFKVVRQPQYDIQDKENSTLTHKK